jgi:hypothetical protein
VLITKCVHRPDFIAVTDREFGPGLILRVQVGILDTVFRLQTYPFDKMLPVHRMLHRSDNYMDSIPLNLVHRGMFLPGGFRCAGNQFLHFLAAAIDRHAFIPDHGYNIAAMLTY